VTEDVTGRQGSERLAIWNKNRAHGTCIKRRACALAVSGVLGLTGLAPLLPAAAQGKAADNAGDTGTAGQAGPPTPRPGPPPPATLPSITAPPIVTPPVATPPTDQPPAPNPTPPAGGARGLPTFTVPTLNPPSTDTSAAPQFTGRVSRITISGNQNISDAAIRAVITQAGLRLGEPYSAGVAVAARDAVKNMGYFNGDVALNGGQDPAGGVDVTFGVKENPVVKAIHFTANTPNGQPTIPAAKLKSLMQTREGQVLNTSVLVTDLDKLFNHTTGYVFSQGYIFDVSSDINIDPLTGVLNVPLVEAHINSITIKGNKKTKTVVITREMRTKPGDVLNINTLQRDETRINNLGLADVEPYDLASTDVGKVDVTIPLVEKKSAQVSVGVGYSSRSKLVGRAELADNNFRGMGERVSLQWEVGGINSQSSLEAGFFEPYLDKRHTSLDIDLYDKAVYRFNSGQFGGGSALNTSGNTSTYLERRKGGVLGINRALGDLLTAGLTFRSETVSTDNVQLQLQDQFILQKGSVTGLGARANYSNSDNALAPAAGGSRALSYEIVTSTTRSVDNRYPSALAPGRQLFGKLGLDLRQYTSLQGPRKPGQFNQPKRVLATRLLIGATARNIPFFEQYFLGGADSLRGYDTDRFWGTDLALVQAELRVPVGKDNNFQAVLLFDGGDAWNSIYQQQGLRQHTAFQFSADYGLGIRLVTPIGPIRLDYAIPTTGARGGRTQFSIGQSF